MIKCVLLLSLVACAFSAAIPEGLLPRLQRPIVGGSDTSISAHPWQVSIQSSGSHFCGGSIYSNQIIVTAAHCLQYVSISDLRIRAGSTYRNAGGVLISVAAFKNHEGYNFSTMVNDIAVMRLSSALTYSATIKNIGLASLAPPNAATAVVTGWGALSYGSTTLPNILQYADVNIVSRILCASTRYSYGTAIQSTMICAANAGKDSCQSDSGGPLVSGGVLVGVVSWGLGCAHRDYPGVYADVASLNSWIVNASEAV